MLLWYLVRLCNCYWIDLCIRVCIYITLFSRWYYIYRFFFLASDSFHYISDNNFSRYSLICVYLLYSCTFIYLPMYAFLYILSYLFPYFYVCLAIYLQSTYQFVYLSTNTLRFSFLRPLFTFLYFQYWVNPHRCS